MQKSPFFQPRSAHHHRRVPSGSLPTTITPGGTKRLVVSNETIDAAVNEHKSPLSGTAANLINAIVGCGIVGIPYALRQSGLVSGILLILLCAKLTQVSLNILIETAKHVHVATYETLCEAAFGTHGFYFVTINMFFCAYGAMISYLMIVKDSFGTLLLGQETTETDESHPAHRWALAPDSLVMRRTLLLLISLLIILPLSCQRDMADLAFTSRWNVVIDTILVAMVAYNALPLIWSRIVEEDFDMDTMAATTTTTHHFASSPLDVHKAAFWLRGETIFMGLGVLSFAFVCQHSAFLIAGSLERPTASRWRWVTGRALCVCAVLSLVCGLSGYLGYGDATQGNILLNLNATSPSANVARALLGTTMLFVYPLESFVARHVGVVLLFVGRHAHEGDDAHILARPDRRVLLTTALYILAVVPAALATDLGPILAITGAVGGSCLSYIGPGLCYLGVHGERFLQLAAQAFGCQNDGETVQQEKDGGSSNVKTTISKNDLAAVESTPLVRDGTTVTSTSRSMSSRKSATTEPILVVGLWSHLVWYATGMPVWCAIARHGQARLQQHIHDLALKSPHPIRIGDVEYKRVNVAASVAEDNEPEDSPSTLVRKHSLPHLHNLSTLPLASSSGGGTGINQQIGQGLLLAQQKKSSHSSAYKTDENAAVEPDPQQEPPQWSDFILAIGYILLGLVAMIAGIYSIFVSK
jgi:solute carrier family 38 (sodium-coupled neutral amino acid transporter), member 11